MFLPLLERVADSSKLMACAILVEVVSVYVMQQLLDRLDSLEAGPCPDLRFGYTEEELYEWYDALGKEGCEIYKHVYRFDLFPYMSSYAILLGALLVQQAKEADFNTQVAMVFPFAMLFDLMETVIPACGCEIYPKRLPSYAVLVGIGANQLKWITLITGLALLSCLFVYNNLIRPFVAPKKKED